LRAGLAGAARAHPRRLAEEALSLLERAARARPHRRGSPRSAAALTDMSAPDDMSPFGRILRELVEELPGAHGAVFVDGEGEPVDQYGRGPLLEIQLTGAQCGLVFARVREGLVRVQLGKPRSLHLVCDRVQLYLRPVATEYLV